MIMESIQFCVIIHGGGFNVNERNKCIAFISFCEKSSDPFGGVEVSVTQSIFPKLVIFFCGEIIVVSSWQIYMYYLA